MQEIRRQFKKYQREFEMKDRLSQKKASKVCCGFDSFVVDNGRNAQCCVTVGVGRQETTDDDRLSGLSEEEGERLDKVVPRQNHATDRYLYQT